MKRLIISLVLISFVTLTFAQKQTEISASKLPKATTEYIKENLPGSTIVRAVKLEQDGVLTYNVGIDIKGRKHLLIFDKDGKFLKKGDNLIDSKSKPKSSADSIKPATKPPAPEKEKK